MKPVTSHYQETRLWQNSRTTLRSLSEPVSKTSQKQNTVIKDQADLTDPPSVSPDARTQKLLDQLAKSFPGITFEIVPDSDFLNLREKAAALGQGKHLLLSESFIARMGSSDKEFENCKTMLLASVLMLSENHAAGVFLSEKQAVSWKINEKDEKKDSETETIAKMLESLKEAKANSSQKFKVSSNVSYETGELHRKLARAGDKALVQSVMSEVYRNIASLRLIACMGDDKERAKAQKAVRALQKLSIRSRQKLRHLDKETLLKLKRQRAIKRQEETKARELQNELKKKQAKRIRLDKKIVEEGDAADREIRRLKQYLSQASNPQLPVSSEIPAPGSLTPAEAAPITTDQITLSEPVTF
ncbi:MAG: hypothetical protein HFI22_12170 [Lachnospiraceae bacterium]|jgi:hypothetical protein|nr:hypothetical protein [Lachnospiraceae bacterium]